MEDSYLTKAEQLCCEVLNKFHDAKNGGFYLYGSENESLILRPKEDYDGAIPSGNSMMAWNLVRLAQLTDDDTYGGLVEEQLHYLGKKAAQYPIGHGMFLLALLNHKTPAPKVTVVLGEHESASELPVNLPPDMAVRLLHRPTKEYPLKDGKTTFYVCKDHTCLPPMNDLHEIIKK